MFTQLKEKLFGKWEEVASECVVSDYGRSTFVTLEKNSKTGEYKAYFEYTNGGIHNMSVRIAKKLLGVD